MPDGGPLESFRPLDGGAAIRLSGFLAQEKIVEALNSRRPDIRACLDAALARHTRPSGKLRIAFLIAPDGTVPLSESVVATFDNDGLTACVNEVVQSLTFPHPDCDGPVLYTHTFVFMLEAEADAGPP